MCAIIGVLQPSSDINLVIDTLRTVLEPVDFSEVEGNSWCHLVFLAGMSRSTVSRLSEVSSGVLLWILQQVASDKMKNYHDNGDQQFLWSFIDSRKLNTMVNLWLKFRQEKLIDAACTIPFYSKLMIHLACGWSLDEMWDFHLNLHPFGLETFYSPRLETATSLALYSSRAFADWRSYLEHEKVDIAEFIDNEMAESPLIKLGWTHDALRRLFESYWEDGTFTFVEQSDEIECRDCVSLLDLGFVLRNNRGNEWGGPIKIQPYWLYCLENVRQGVNAHAVPQNGVGADQDLTDIIDSVAEPQGRLVNHIPEETRPSFYREETHPQALVTPAMTSREESRQQVDQNYLSAIAKLGQTAYRPLDVICMRCWVYFQQTGERWTRDVVISGRDDSLDSEDEFSPSLAHT